MSLSVNISNAPDVRWGVLKNDVIQCSHEWSVEKSKQRHKKVSELQNELLEIKIQIDQDNIDVCLELQQQYSAIEKELENEIKYYTEGTMFRSRCRWYE